MSGNTRFFIGNKFNVAKSSCTMPIVRSVNASKLSLFSCARLMILSSIPVIFRMYFVLHAKVPHITHHDIKANISSTMPHMTEILYCNSTHIEPNVIVMMRLKRFFLARQCIEYLKHAIGSCNYPIWLGILAKKFSDFCCFLINYRKF